MKVEPSTCPVCDKVFDPLRARALIVSAGRVRAFCSETCRAEAERGDGEAGRVVDAMLAAAPDRPNRRLMYAFSALAVCGAVVLGVSLRRGHPIKATVASAEASVVPPAFSVEDALRILESASATPGVGAVVSDIPERDLWLHPLSGPTRRLPVRNTRRFGAPREGLRPEACRSGHCGVDLGEDRGEWVFAAHDGVVERVVEDDTGNEGRYVRLNHRGGTLTTSYMHLDTVRQGLKAGVPVKAGDPIGTVGETGIFHSGPHLHFQIGVRAHPGDVELFIDPEPLLHLWPLRGPYKDTAPRHLAHAPSTDTGPQGM